MDTFTHNLTLNNYTAKVSFKTSLHNGKLDWTIELFTDELGDRYTTITGGLVTIIQPVPAPTPAPAPAQTDKDRHINFLRVALADIEAVTGREAKALGTKMLYDYLIGDALEFTKNHLKFKEVVIAKGYELKAEAPEKYAMIYTINRVLNALGAPLTKPPTPAPAPTPAPPPAPAPAPVASVPPTVKPKDAVNPDLELFKAVATRLKCETALNNLKEYFGYWQGAVKRGHYAHLLSKAASMEEYMASWWCYDDDEYGRARLMKDIFAKKGLVWSEEAMPMYYEWLKTYIPPPRVRGQPRPNRYTKMCAFLDTYKSAFTAPTA
jgi:hypothetical protein